ncbi:MAG: hypothetical protein AAF628_00265 [Planctomycetota bacterium]
MAKSRRKSNGAKRGTMKPKRMGKGWSTMRKQRGSEKPVDRSKSKGTDTGGASTPPAEGA